MLVPLRCSKDNQFGIMSVNLYYLNMYAIGITLNRSHARSTSANAFTGWITNRAR